MDKIRNFDRQWKQVHENDFLLGKLSAGLQCGCGMIFLFIPVGIYKYAEYFMWVGCLLCTAGVNQYMQLYLCVREDGRPVSIGEKLKYMPVDMYLFKKVRMGYLNRICIRLGTVSFLLQQLVAYLNHSFGWKSILFAAVWVLNIWIINGITIFAAQRKTVFIELAGGLFVLLINYMMYCVIK